MLLVGPTSSSYGGSQGDPATPDTTSLPSEPIRLFLCGDVMTGRGVDQVLPHPSNPRLHEPSIQDARLYVTLAVAANGPIPQPVDYAYIWGVALEELGRQQPDARIINLETSITTSGDYHLFKGIHYRMHPQNVPCLTAAGIDVCALANNHLLDWGKAGLRETLATLKQAGIQTAGAGHNLEATEAPAVVEVEGKGRILVFSYGTVSSGIPTGWRAGVNKPGVNLLADLSPAAMNRILTQVSAVKRPGDIVVASIHWGHNWGYQIPTRQRDFAHRLINEAGVDIVHGHSSHHVKGIEVYQDKLILYGCGDFITDYEGISGHEEYRAELGIMYFADLNPANGQLVRLVLVPTRIKNFRIQRANREETQWLADMLNREGKELGTSVEEEEALTMMLKWD
ncbi:MAG: CapA family protein [Fidelibacterota bacterium]|nr:MAG: CapA family protein [Candidatus Neomarinimicrobiota bacterium]